MGTSSAENYADLQVLAGSIDASAIHPWATLPPEQQRPIERAIAPETPVSGIVYPSSAAELGTVVAAVDRLNWHILPCGAGSKLDWGGLVGGQPAPGNRQPGRNIAPLLVVSTAHLNRLVEHAVGDLTITVEAGMRFADVQATLAKAGQFLAIDPSDPEHATIGGIVATADTGSLRQRYNSVRDMLLGLSFVRVDGQLAKAGGRVVKNVAGYDLMKLFTGSYGTLGIITQVTFRVYPLPEASQTIVLSGDPAAIAEAAQTLLRSALTPSSADIVSQSVATDLAIATKTALAVRFQSILPSVQAQIARMGEVAQALGLTQASFTDTDDTALWQQLPARMGIRPQTDAIACKIGISPTQATALLTLINEVSIAPWAAQIHAASGLGRLVLDGATPPEVLLRIRTICQANNGFLTVLQAPIALKQAIDVWGYAGNALTLMHRLKHQFDPNGRFSPYRFVGGI